MAQIAAAVSPGSARDIAVTLVEALSLALLVAGVVARTCRATLLSWRSREMPVVAHAAALGDQGPEQE